MPLLVRCYVSEYVLKPVFEVKIDRLICNPYLTANPNQRSKTISRCMEQNTLLFEEQFLEVSHEDANKNPLVLYPKRPQLCSATST